MRPSANFRSLVLIVLGWLSLQAASVPSTVAQPTSPASPSADVPVWEPGRDGLEASLLRPFRATYSQRAGGAPAGRRTLSLERELGPEGPTWRYAITIETTVTVHDELLFSEADFRPRARRVAVPGGLQRIEVWRDFESALALQLDAAGDPERQEIATRGPRFAASGLELITALFGSGTFRMPIYSSDFGAQGDLWVEVEVEPEETLSAAGRAWHARPVRESLLDVSGSPLTMPDGSRFPTLRKWLVPEPPYLIRAAFGPLEVTLQSVTPFETETLSQPTTDHH